MALGSGLSPRGGGTYFIARTSNSFAKAKHQNKIYSKYGVDVSID